MEKSNEKENRLKRYLFNSILWSTIYVLLGAFNLYVFGVIVGPRLIAIKIVSPTEMKEISGEITQVTVAARNIKLPIYILVETPQSTLWVQGELFSTRFKENLPGRARLGQGEVGVGDIFRIFAIATKDNLQIGPLVTIPPDSIHSNTVNVRRVR